MRSLGYLAMGLVFTGLAAITFACSTKSSATDGGNVCTAGNFVYCRCEDRAEGTKLCHDDGKGFDACKCDGSGTGPIGGYDAGPLEPFDAGPTEGAHIDNACTGKLGIVAGGATGDNSVYLLGYKGDGVFESVKSSGGVAGPISVVASAGTLLASYKGTFAILTTKYANNTWIPIAAIGNADVTTYAKSTTQSVLFGTSPKLMFISGDDNRYHVATYGTAGWDDGSAVAEFNADAGLSGKSAPGLAAAGTQLVAVVSTSDGALARETFSDGAWGPFIKAPENAQNVPPALAALESGSPKDLLLVWPAKDSKLHSASRDALSKTWSNGSIIDAGLLSNQATIAPLPNGDALVVIVATDHGYTSLFHAQTGMFDAPTELVPGANPKLAGVPGVTRGHCGEDASIVYAEDAGPVKVLRYKAGKLEGPYAVPGVPNGAKYVGIGELP